MSHSKNGFNFLFPCHCLENMAVPTQHLNNVASATTSAAGTSALRTPDPEPRQAAPLEHPGDPRALGAAAAKARAGDKLAQGPSSLA